MPPVELSAKALALCDALESLWVRTMEGYKMVDDALPPAEVQRLMAAALSAEPKALTTMPAVLRRYAAEFKDLSAQLEAEMTASAVAAAQQAGALSARVRSVVPGYVPAPPGADVPTMLDSLRRLLEHTVLKLNDVGRRVETLERDAAAQKEALGRVQAVVEEGAAVDAEARAGRLAEAKRDVEARARARRSGGVRFLRIQKDSSGYAVGAGLQVIDSVGSVTPVLATVVAASPTSEGWGIDQVPENILRPGNANQYWGSLETPDAKYVKLDLGDSYDVASVLLWSCRDDIFLVAKREDGGVIARKQIVPAGAPFKWNPHRVSIP